MDDFITIIKKAIANNQNFILVTLLGKIGSSQNNIGLKMIIHQDLSIEGSIGGGMVEVMVVKRAVHMFLEKRSIVEEFIPNNRQKTTKIVCEGTVKVLLEYVDIHDVSTKAYFQELINFYQKQINFFAITKLTQSNKMPLFPEKWICTETGFFGREAEDMKGLLKQIKENFESFKYEKAYIHKGLFLVEPYFNNDSLIIIGGGHIARVLSMLCHLIGFHVTVVDDREEFANSRRFDSANEIIVVPGFERIREYLKINRHSFVVIATRGHSNDQEVLVQILQSDAKYIGMVGSRNKRNYIFQNLLEAGVSFKELERVHSPIGIDIKGETPEEIAISIVAELVSIRRLPLSH